MSVTRPLIRHVSNMSTVRNKTSIIVGMLLLGAILLAAALWRRSAPVALSAGFLGYTNGATGERFARFVIRNQSRRTIRRWGYFDREVRHSASLTYSRNIGPHVLLSPGQEEVVLVPLDAEPAATFQPDWRAVFYWRREDVKTRFDIWADSSSWLPTWLHGRGVHVNRAPSQWLDQ